MGYGSTVDLRGVFERQLFLILLHHLIVFEEDSDSRTLPMIIAGYPQFNALNAAVEQTMPASGMSETGRVQREDAGTYWSGRMRGGKAMSGGADPLRSVPPEPTRPTPDRTATRRVWAERVRWRRCSSVTDPYESVPSPRLAIGPFPPKQGKRPVNRIYRTRRSWCRMRR